MQQSHLLRQCDKNRNDILYILSMAGRRSGATSELMRAKMRCGRPMRCALAIKCLIKCKLLLILARLACALAKRANAENDELAAD